MNSVEYSWLPVWVNYSKPTARCDDGRKGVGDDLRLAQLLCSRLCHDLAGPAGAIGNGLEMLMDDPGDAATRELLVESGGHLNRRLAFYRTAFGLRGGRPEMALDEARSLAGGYLAGGRTTLDWPENVHRINHLPPKG